MAKQREWVDTTRPPGEADRLRRQRWFRLTLPVATAVLLSAAMVAITQYVEWRNRHDALELADDLIAALETAVQRDVEAFLLPPAAVVAFVGDVADQGISGDADNPEDSEIERALRSALNRLSTITALYLGDGDGDFLMVQRQPSGTESKFIAQRDGERTVRVIRRDADGSIIDDLIDPTDQFDPRTRSWYLEAAEGQVVWSDVYRFSTDGVAGITASTRVANLDEGVPATVAGVDLAIDTVNQFLNQIELGRGARIAVISTDGEVIAYPASLAAAPLSGGQLPHVQDFGDRVLDRAFQHFRIERRARDDVTIGEDRYVISSASLAEMLGRDWWFLLIVPEETFVGFLQSNARITFWLSAGVICLASVVAGVIAWQALAADRRAMLAAAAEKRTLERSEAIRQLGALVDLDDPTDQRSLVRLTELISDTFDAGRTSIWSVDKLQACLTPIANFERERRHHAETASVPANHLGELWQRLLQGDWLEVRTAEERDSFFVKYYLEPLGIDRFLMAPIRDLDHVLGVIVLSDPQQFDDPVAVALVEIAATFLKARLRADRPRPVEPKLNASLLPRQAVANDLEPVGIADGLSQRRERHLLRELDRTESAGRPFSAKLFPQVAVLSLQFGDDIILGRGLETKAAGSTIQELATACEAEADRLKIPYLRIQGGEIVAADGLVRDPESAVRAIADLALALQPMCRALSVGMGQAPSYRLGIDFAPAIGAVIGSDARLFNLWGDAVKTASLAARSADVTTIQVTETVWAGLGNDYLLRSRGSFFRQGIGLTETFVLAGRL